MKPALFEVLSTEDVARIDAATMDILATVGVRVGLKRARDDLRAAGAQVDDASRMVRFPEALVRRAVAQAPSSFSLYGADPDFRMEVGGDHVNFAALGTPTKIIDHDSGEVRPTTLADVRNHLRIIDALDHIHNSQMDVWPNDIPMTTIHAEAILAWAQNSRKSFGMGCYGVLPSTDMMEMMAIVVGGKEELRQRPRFFAICSAMSPLQMINLQIEGLYTMAEYGQPVAMSPEAMAGSTAPATLAGLLAQHTAEVLAHVTLAQVIRPGTPVLYGSVSTITDMATAGPALGSAETGIISAASAQLARHYGLPCRTVAGATESKTEDLQCAIERASTLVPAVLAGVNFITCGGTLESTMTESHPVLVLDDEICGRALRLARGIEVTDDTLALDVIKEVGVDGMYLEQMHTAQHYRREHLRPRLLRRENRDTWLKQGAKTALDLARERVREILAAHTPRALDPGVERELQAFLKTVQTRSMGDYEAAEWES